MKQPSFLFAYLLLQDAFISSAEIEKTTDGGSLDHLRTPVSRRPKRRKKKDCRFIGSSKNKKASRFPH
jgi:hypothetical protein